MSVHEPLLLSKQCSAMRETWGYRGQYIDRLGRCGQYLTRDGGYESLAAACAAIDTLLDTARPTLRVIAYQEVRGNKSAYRASTLRQREESRL